MPISQNVIDAITASRDLASAVSDRLDEVIAHKKIFFQDIDQENRLQARAMSQASLYSTLLGHLQAVAVTVQPPSLADIQEVRDMLNRVKNLALVDALAQAGLDLFETAIGKAGDLVNKTAPHAASAAT